MRTAATMSTKKQNVLSPNGGSERSRGSTTARGTPHLATRALCTRRWLCAGTALATGGWKVEKEGIVVLMGGDVSPGGLGNQSKDPKSGAIYEISALINSINSPSPEIESELTRETHQGICPEPSSDISAIVRFVIPKPAPLSKPRPRNDLTGNGDPLLCAPGTFSFGWKGGSRVRCGARRSKSRRRCAEN